MNFSKGYILFILIIFFSFSFLRAGSIGPDPVAGYIQNKGQILDQNLKPVPGVLFLLNGQGMNVQLRSKGFSYDVWTRNDNQTQREIPALNEDKRIGQPGTFTINYHRIDVEFNGANDGITLLTAGESSEYENYFLNGIQGDGAAFIRHYSTVTYQNVWNGIDVEFTMSDGKPKYNFILHSGAKVSDIKLQIAGPSQISLDNGSLVMKTSINDVIESVPESYYIIQGRKKSVSASFVANNDGTFGLAIDQDVVGFSQLVIDPNPNLLWGTYFGGTDEDNSYAICYGSSGSGYTAATGNTKSLSNIASSGAFKTTYGGGLYDVFVVKFDITGALLWSTYFGSSNEDQAMSITTDASGNLYIAGFSASTAGIATAGTQQTTYGGVMDAFVAKFSSGGSLTWATYCGGTSSDYGYGVGIDASGNVYLSGLSASNSNMATVGAFKTALSGSLDGFLEKYNSSGVRQWGTYYGGTSTDYCRTMAVDPTTGNIVICGETNSANTGNAIATPGSYKQSPASASNEIFVAVFNGSGSRQWGTYYGGTLDDYVWGVVTDPQFNVYIAGSSYSTDNSTNLLATSGAFQTAFGGGSTDAILCKFNSTGNRVWSTYYGAGGIESAYAISLDANNNLILCGPTGSNGTTMSTSNTFQTTFAGGTADAFVSTFDSSGSRIWSTYYGGIGDDNGYGLATDGLGNIFLSGNTTSSNMSTSGAYQTSNAGGYDAFVARLVDCPPTFGTVGSNSPVCAGASLTLTATGGVTYSWSGPNGFTSNLQTPVITNPTAANSGTYTVIITTAAGCVKSLPTTVTVLSSSKPIVGFTQNALNECYNGNSFTFTDTSTVSVGTITRLWTLSTGSNDTNKTIARSFLTSGTYTIKLVATTVSGCSDSVTKTLNVYPNPSGTLNSSIPLSQCFPSNSFTIADTGFHISSGSFTTKWYFGDGSTSNSQIATNGYAAPGTFLVTHVTTTDKGCIDSTFGVISRTVWAQPSSGYNQNSLSQCSNGNSFTFTNTSTITSGTMTPTWYVDGANNGSINFTTSLSVGIHSVKLVEISNNGCSDSTTKTITVYPNINVGYTTNNPNQCAQSSNFIFTDTSTISSGSFTRSWTLGDGTFAASQIVNKSYGAFGTYNVKLVTTTDHGCMDSVQKTVSTYVQPSSGFSQNTLAQCYSATNPFVFTDTSTIQSGTISRTWYLNNVAQGVNPSPWSLTGLTAATYNIKLVISSDHGCMDSTTKTINVYPRINVGFTSTASGACGSGKIVTFTDTISSGTYTRQWDFGDASYSAAQSPVKTYSSNGSYNVTLTTTTPNGCMDSATKNIVINSFPQPLVGFTQNGFGECLSGNSFIVNDTSTISSGTISRQWKFSDGGTALTSSVNKSFLTSGTYTITLIETSNNNCVDSLTKTFNVYPQTSIGFTVNNVSQCFSINNFIYNDTSTVSSGSYSRVWSLGDGTNAFTSSVTKSYSTYGIYQVKLVTTTNNSCKDSTQSTVNLRETPGSGFTQTNLAQCFNGNSFTFTDTTKMVSGFYSGTFYINGTPVASGSPVITSKVFTSSGAYSVKLVSTSWVGCADSTTKTVNVYPQTNIGFFSNYYTECQKNNSFQLLDTSTISTGTYSRIWYLGDGSVSFNSFLTKSYSSSGSFSVNLVTTTDNGCKDSVQKIITVKDQPYAGYTQNNLSQCFNGNTFVLSDTTVSGLPYLVQWKFSDGSSPLFTTSINKSFTLSGTYSITLVSTSTNGCVDSAVKSFSVYPQTSIGYTVNNASQCVSGNSFQYSDTSSVSSGSFSRIWYLGDGSTSFTGSVTKSYSSTGNYQVNLVTTTNNGCKDSVQKSMNVKDQPYSGYTQNNLGQCLNGNNFTLTDTTVSILPYSITWKFSDGSSPSSLSVLNKSFSNAGNIFVKLVAVGSNGCSDSVTKTFSVYPQTNIGFSANSYIQCLNGNNFQLIDTSTITSGTYNRNWKLGDGSTSTNLFINKGYLSSGNYSVKLITQTDHGCLDSVQKTVSVNPEPIVGFTQNNMGQCLNGNSFSLSDTSSIPSGSLTRKWSYSDGDSSLLANPSKSFLVAGNVFIKLIETTSAGCSDSVTKLFTVFPQTSVNFTVNDSLQCLNGNNFQFNDFSTLTSGTYTRLWNLGDGSTSASSFVSKSYGTTGTYSVKLVTTTNNGCKDSSTQNIMVNVQPHAGFSQNSLAQCLRGNSFTLTDTSSIPSGSVSRLWKFSDGDTSTTSPTNKTFPAFGSVTATLFETSGFGCTDSITRTFTIFPQTLVGFSVNKPSQCLTNNLFSFNDTSRVPYGFYTRQWNLGDGTFSNSITVNKSYANVGAYNVTLTTTSNNGCIDSGSFTINLDYQPKAGFNQNTLTSCLSGNSFHLTDTSFLLAGNYFRNWYFSDGDTSTQSSINKTFTSPGNFTIKLVSSSSSGCGDSIQKTFTVYPQSNTGFEVNNPSQCFRTNQFVFIDTTAVVSGSLTRTWGLGDGTSSNYYLPVKSYSAAGTYSVKLVTRTNFGCIDSSSQNINVWPEPKAGFNWNSLSQCLSGNSFVLIDTTVNPVGSYSVSWQFSDNDTYTTNVVTKSFTNPGNYTAKLVVNSSLGCRDSVTKTITVFPQTNVGFYIPTTTSQCQSGNHFTFIDTSNSYTGSLTRQWDLGDGNSGNTQVMYNSYWYFGNYTVKLKTTTHDGCVDSAMRSITIYPQPQAAFALNTTGQCLNGNRFVFADTSSIANGSLSRMWYFSNGDYDTSMIQDKTFSNSGDYRVSLYVFSEHYCLDSTFKIISVYSQPQAGFDQTSLAQCFKGNSFEFNDTTSIPSGVITHSWDFGDLTGSFNKKVTKVYDTDGTYNVKLVILTDNNCTDSITKSIKVNPSPITGFTQNSTTQCFNNNKFIITDTSSLNTGTFSRKWYFPDTTIAGSVILSKSFKTPGNFQAKLVLITDKNCSDSVSKILTVWPQAKAGFMVNNTVQCSNENQFIFTDTSTFSKSRIWYFGDTTTISGSSVATKKYSDIGYYYVSLKITDFNNCTDSTTTKITVNLSPPKPVITQLSRTQLQCTPATSYQWYFDNFIVPNSNFQILSVNENGIYQVKVTSNNGCSSTSDTFGILKPFSLNDNGSINIYPNPSADKTIVDFHGLGGNKTVEIYNTAGRLIKNITTDDITATIYLDEFVTGVYLLKIITIDGELDKWIMVY